MYELIIENQKGEQLNLTRNPNYAITHIDGLNPPPSQISTAIVGRMDGETITGSRISKRNLVITLKILRDVEKNRIALYRYFPQKQNCKIYYKNQSRDVFVQGEVEVFEDDFFTQLQEVQISFICPQPYFKDINEIYFDISQVLSRFEFPFAIEEEGIIFSELDTTLVGTVLNRGDVESGVVITISAYGQIINPRIYDTQTRRMFGIRITMENGDRIIINTNKGSKSVMMVSGGVSRNIINSIMAEPEWFQLHVGENSFTYDCDSGNEFFNMTFAHTDLYMGV